MDLVQVTALLLILVTCGIRASDFSLTEEVISEEDKASILEASDDATAFSHFLNLYRGTTSQTLRVSTNPTLMKQRIDAQKRNFVQNIRTIREHNAKYAKGESEYSMTVNSFTIMSSSDRQQFLGLRNVSGANANEFLVTETVRLRAGSGKVSYPTSLDWNRKGMMSGVKNQGTCGSCWTYPATALLEFAYKKSTRRMVQLSEQELLDCTYDNMNYNGCGGGWYYQAWSWIIKNNNHLALMSDYRYNGRDSRCQKSYYKNALEGKVKLTGYVHVTPKDENKIVQALQDMPLAVAFHVEDAFFQLGGGVFNGCWYPQASNHAVTLTGYTAYYWEIKNSWGGDWGSRGYGRFKRRGDICNLLSTAYYIQYTDLDDRVDPTDGKKTTTEGRTCADIDAKCAEYKTSGYCTTEYVEWMGTNCKATCGKCGGGDCKDKNEYCNSWADSGYCTSSANVQYMSDNCAKSCGTCSQEEEKEEKKEDVSCNDANTGCPGWRTSGYCNNAYYRAYMNTNCKKSCGLCGGHVKDDCVDVNGNCAGWAKYGYCQSSTVYMRANCQKSCGFCSGGGGGGCSGGLTKCADGVCRHAHMC